MGGRFHIDGTQEFGFSPINRFEYSFYMYLNTVKRITSLYHFASVDDLKGYVAHFCDVRLRSFDTFIKVVVKQKDYVTANCILRMLGDCVAIFRLIYMEPNLDYRLLRHCIYEIDGCEKNLMVLPEEDINKGCLPDDELKDANRQIRLNREHRQRRINTALGMLDKSPLKSSNKEAFESIVKFRNWKFKEFKPYTKKGGNQYKWQELYELIDCCKYFDLLSYISQYAHGLSMSNLVIEMDENNLHGVVAESVGLLDRLHEYTLEFFAEENEYILEGLLDPEMSEKIRTCFDEQHRPDAATWNRGVMNKIREARMLATSQYC